ncbi:hypothetical protein FHX64_001820 [Microbacter margulisiae]|uniref:Uncharacterized protein n=1 Tax=Microbacter margulisiae TaxID=1350067 RepID=A0A7W5DRB2_9PORP|nr:hypothetical protein [Microbacter margulisiae]
MIRQNNVTDEINMLLHNTNKNGDDLSNMKSQNHQLTGIHSTQQQ